MPSWLALTVVTLFVALALGVTIAAWQARRTTPRKLSLLLSGASCLAIFIAALDLAIPLPRGLCGRTLVVDDAELERALEAELGAWSWGWRPCARLEVRAAPAALGSPIDFARLAALAAESGVVVDVAVGDSSPLQGERLELVMPTESAHLPITTPVPTSQLDLVVPRFIGRDDGAVCKIGKGPESSGPEEASLHALLDGAGAGPDYNGFHRLSCRLRGDDRGEPASAYIHVTTSGVVVTTEKPALVDFCRKPGSSSFGLHKGLKTVRENDASVASATMLVLDRPQLAASCERARTLLERGATVVIARPGGAFLEACQQWLPVAPVRKNRRGQVISFDRRPRLSYIRDDFAKGLRWSPSCVFEPNGTCDALANAPVQLPDSDKLQGNAAKTSCTTISAGEFEPEVNCRQESPLAEYSDDFFPAKIFTRKPVSADRQPDDRRRLERSSPASALTDLLAVAETRDSAVYWENEIVVVFTHDQREPTQGTLDRFLERGSRIHIAEIQDPYGESLKWRLHGPVPSGAAQPEPRLVSDPMKRQTRHESDDCGGPLARCIASDSLGLPELDQGTGADLRLHARGRFKQHGLQINKAPVQFEWWALASDKPPGQAAPVELATTTDANGLVERSLAIGAMVGKGHLLFLSYSLFEHDDPEVQCWTKAPQKDQVLGGLQMVEDLHHATEKLLTRLAGPLLAVELQADGALRATFTAPDDPKDDKNLDTRTFTGQGRSIVASLVDFHVDRGELVYALPAQELSGLPGCTALRSEHEHEPIHACPPEPAELRGGGMDAATSLRLLARYTGGSDDPAGASGRDSLHTRSLGLGLLSLTFLFAWGRRARRRMAGLTARHQLRDLEQLVQRRYDPPDAVVAAAGDWDGRSSTWPRTGSFGGFRPLEAGDRPTAIVLQDLVLAAQGGPQLLPRVSQRIEESAPSVAVLVNLGGSMRVPGHGDAGKAMFAGRIALHVAASAWKIRGEAAIQAVGIRGDGEIVEPVSLSPGHEELAANLRARLQQPPHREHAPWPDDPPECGAVVYVSDFQLEDQHALQRWVDRLEGAGIRVGGVMIYSPIEFTMIEGGRLAGSGVWADRADWDPDDVFAAFSRRRDVIERIFDTATTGGLIVAGTHFSQDDVEVALASGRLLQILR